MSGTTGREKIPQNRREEVLERDEYSCRMCPAKGPRAGGTAELHVHHADPDPDDGDRHALSNLLTVCVGCHTWHHKRPEPDETPVQITAADKEELRPHDYEILKVLAEDGPLSTGEIQDRISVDVSALTVRERLWLLMGLDYEVPDSESPLVDQSVKTGDWGLVGQIEESERGRIPDDDQSLIRRVNDERVRRALARGYDRETVAEMFDVAERTTWHKHRRAYAYDFPLDALERGSTESSRDRSDTAQDEAPDASAVAAAADAQQQLDAVADGAGDSDDETAVSEVPHDESSGVDGSAVTAGELHQAIETLRAVADQVGNA
jgi:hypothetical protein